MLSASLIHGNDKGQRGGQGLQRRHPQVNLVEVIEKYLGGGRATVHHHEISFVERAEHGIQSAGLGQIRQFNGFAVKPFQRRVFIVAVAGRGRMFLLFEILDEIDGKETFADTAHCH